MIGIAVCTVAVLYVATANAQTIDDYPCSFEILSIDHTFGSSYIGQYFNFMVADADCAFGAAFAHNINFDVFYSGTNSVRNVVMWRTPNGGSIGDGHGRLSSGAAANQWVVGERIAFVNVAGICCTETESPTTAQPSLRPTSPPTRQPSSSPTSSPTHSCCECSLEDYLDTCYCENSGVFGQVPRGFSPRHGQVSAARGSVENNVEAFDKAVGGAGNVAAGWEQHAVHFWGAIISTLLVINICMMAKRRPYVEYGLAHTKSDMEE